MAGRMMDQDGTSQRIEKLMRELFVLHDLNGDGLLQMHELVKLNEKIAILHSGLAVDEEELRARYENLFRTKLDPEGKPVLYGKFREYLVEVLDAQDKDLEAQEMIMEQFVAEAQCGREVGTVELGEQLEDVVPTLGSIALEGSPSNWCTNYLSRQGLAQDRDQKSLAPVVLPPKLLSAEWFGLEFENTGLNATLRKRPMDAVGCLWDC
jgi:hypothetical protein